MPWMALPLQRAASSSRKSWPSALLSPIDKNYSTTNHLERLDPALSRPGRMDVWIEFKNASKWQAEALFRNFFPSTDKDDEPIEGDLEGIELPSTPAPQSPSSHSSTLWSMSPSFSSSTSSLACSTKNSQSPPESVAGSEAFGAKNQAYLPPPIEEHITACQHSAKPLDGVKLAQLAKKFADSIPDDEFSVAALQGCEFVFKCDFGRMISLPWACAGVLWG